jgi:PP-loop superfamily ATP-utilizing enzyme
MDSSSNASTIDLTLSSSDVEMSSPKSIKSPNIAKAKIGRHGLEQYYTDFKEYTAGDFKGKTSARCTICKETVWHLKASTSNYSRHRQRNHPAEFQLHCKKKK